MKKKLKNKNNEKYNTLFKYIFIFFVGCLIGWIYEEIFYFVTENKIVNSGFLYGPYLPVYGVGSVFIYLFLNKLKKYPILIFLLSTIITGIVEYITGFILWEVYNRRWWDYTGLFMDIGGYVCLRSVISFAFGALLLIYITVPFIEKIIKKIGVKKCLYVSIIVSAIMLIDCIITITHRY